jgi:hypothetical protein
MTTDYKISNVKEKFEIAILDLALGEGDITSRIDTAYHRFWTISDDSFPEAIRPLRKKIEELITEIPAEKGYIIPENIKKMSKSKATEIASLIVQKNNELKSF